MPGAQGPKTVKGAQSDANYISRLLARSECLPGGGKNYSYATATNSPYLAQHAALAMPANTATTNSYTRSQQHIEYTAVTMLRGGM